MGHVFISYAHEDAQEASGLARALELSRISVWWDPKIQLGKPFSSAIQNALVEAAAVVVLWSRASIGSPWVLKEARLASQRGVLLPALLDRVTPPGEFAGLDCADLSDWDPDRPHREFDQLRRVVLSSVSGRAGAETHSYSRRADPGGVETVKEQLKTIADRTQQQCSQ